MSTLDPSSLPVEHRDLYQPDLQEVASVLQRGLRDNFAEAEVTVVDCPDMREAPWGLASQGICGQPRLLDIGGPPFLLPLVQRNNEMMPNAYIGPDKSVVSQESRIARTFDEDDSYTVMKLPAGETRNAVLGNVLVCAGADGKVLRIAARRRTGPKNLVTCMREALAAAYPGQPVGLGGVFNIAKGKANIHIMPDFSPCPINSDIEVNKWLRYYEMSAPFTCLSVFLANDPGLDLRVEHSHGWGEGGQGGHYHYDTTPDEVEYAGYYCLAERVYRVDRPAETHQMGRD